MWIRIWANSCQVSSCLQTLDSMAKLPNNSAHSQDNEYCTYIIVINIMDASTYLLMYIMVIFDYKSYFSWHGITHTLIPWNSNFTEKSCISCIFVYHDHYFIPTLRIRLGRTKIYTLVTVNFQKMMIKMPIEHYVMQKNVIAQILEHSDGQKIHFWRFQPQKWPKLRK